MDVLTPRLTRGAKPPPGSLCCSDHRRTGGMGRRRAVRAPVSTSTASTSTTPPFGGRAFSSTSGWTWSAFCRAALPRNDVTLVQYFTAPLDPSRGRDGQRARQDAYLAALRVTPGVQTHHGRVLGT